MNIIRTAISTIAHFLLAGVYLVTIFGFRTDFQAVGDVEPFQQVVFWVLYAIYIVFTFPLTLMIYAFPELLGLFGKHFTPVWLLLQLGISYIQVRIARDIHRTRARSGRAATQHITNSEEVCTQVGYGSYVH